MHIDIKEHVPACPTCARNKHGNQSPTGFLQPLLTPSKSWSYIAPDFVINLPSLESNIIILTIVFKSAHFIPLTKLPTALEIAQLPVNHVFCIHGISTDTVLIKAFSLSPRSGGHTAVHSGPRSASHPIIIPSPMVRWRDVTRNCIKVCDQQQSLLLESTSGPD